MIGTLFDAGVWYYVKNLQIFDEEEPPLPKRMPHENHDEEEVKEQNARNHQRIQESEKL